MAIVTNPTSTEETTSPVEPVEETEEEVEHQYKIYTARTVSTVYYVSGRDEDDARDNFWDGTYDDSEEIDSYDEEISEIIELDAEGRDPRDRINTPQPHRPTILMNENN